MSVIACIVEGNGYEIAADSITIRGWTQSKSDRGKFSKLFEVDGLVVGGVGLVEEISLLRLFTETHKPSASTVAALLEFLSEFSDWKNKKTDNSNTENAYIIGFEGKVFYIHGWLVEEIVKYEAIGAGEDFALAALYLGHTAKKAVETAIELSVFCEGPVQVIKK